MAGPVPILSIVGPTASGKSDLALKIALQTGAEILSVDSMQVYQGMDIGTAKPTPKAQAQVRHHLIDLVGADESFTVARFVELADRAIADARHRAVPLIATGGTPLYFMALFHGLFEGPAADPQLRRQLRSLPVSQLHGRLAAVDPASAARIHANDVKRLIRALEVYELTGKPLSALQSQWGSGSWRHDAIWIGLHWTRDALNRRINARVKAMLAGGWVRETRVLLEKYGSLSPTASEATGYRELIQHLQGRISLEDAAEQIKIATRQLARRQMKWLRRWRHVHWLDSDQPLEALAKSAIQIWKQPLNASQAPPRPWPPAR